MQAKIGDWLVVQSRSDSHHARRAVILAVHADGGPPYTVRWTDDGRETVVFPGPDATVVTAQRQAELDRQKSRRIAEVQSAILADKPTRA